MGLFLTILFHWAVFLSLFQSCFIILLGFKEWKLSNFILLDHFKHMLLLLFITKLCLTLCDPLDRGPLGFPAHGISQARILEWAAFSSSKGSSWPRGRTQVSCVSWVAGKFFTLSHLRSPQRKYTVRVNTLSLGQAHHLWLFTIIEINFYGSLVTWVQICVHASQVQLSISALSPAALLLWNLCKQSAGRETVDMPVTVDSSRQPINTLSPHGLRDIYTWFNI